MSLLASDSETHLFRPGLAIPRPVCWSWARPGEKGWLLGAEDGLDFLEAELAAGTILIYHHAPFDLAVAAAHRPRLIRPIFEALDRGQIRDTKTRQQLIDIRVGRRKNPTTRKKEVWRNGQWVTPDYTLAGNPKRPGSTGLVGLYFGKDRSADKGPDAWRTNYGSLEGVPVNEYPREAYDYAVEDADDALAVHLEQARQWNLDPEEPFPNEIEQNRAAFGLKLISAWGVRTDAATIDALEAACRRVRDEIRKKMMAPGVPGCEPCKGEICVEHGLYRYDGPKKDPRRKIVKNTKVIKARVEVAFAELGLPVPKTKGGVRSPPGTKTDKDTLVLSGDPLLEELAEAGPASTVLQTFIPALRQGIEVPSNTQFDELLDNGRISSSSPNWNNLPRGDVLVKLLGYDVRSAVVPRPGFLLCSVDYDCAELRSHAQVNTWLAREHGWPEPEAARFFREQPDGDPHLELAAAILRITPEEAASRKDAGDKEIKGLRQAMKAVNFGLPGGMGPAKLVESARKGYGVKLTMSEARHRRVDWKRRWPEMGRYLDWISEKTQGSFDVTQYVSGRTRGRCGYSDAANTLWSGLTADGAKAALWDVLKECYLEHLGSPLYGSRIVLFLYDELILEVPEDVAHEAAMRQTELMIAAMQRYTPDVPTRASPALMRRWYKQAVAVYDASGRLVPWEPVRAAVAA